MSLQDIFKQFYGRAKDVDIGPGKVVNSAMSSLNSFSSRLDRRRKSAAENHAKEEAIKEEGKEQAQPAKEEAKS
jgi:hypothetical protein